MILLVSDSFNSAYYGNAFRETTERTGNASFLGERAGPRAKTRMRTHTAPRTLRTWLINQLC